MKHRISITLEEDILLKLKEAVRTDRAYRNQSHFVEEAVRDKVFRNIDE